MVFRYAVLHHTDIPSPHFDLLVETVAGSDLATWRVGAWPVESPTPATRVKDHRRVYLDYEGDLTDRRGRVERVAGGTCDVVVGEGAVWTVTLRSGGPPATIHIRQIDGDRWEIAPSS